MCRRIVLLDHEETSNVSQFFGCNLGNEIYTLQGLENMDPSEKMKILQLGAGDAAMLVGSLPFKYLREHYHFSVRNENYFDCSKLYRLSIEGGAFVKCVTEVPTPAVVSQFMSAEFTTPREFPNFQSAVIKTLARAYSFLDYIDRLKLETSLGADYEASGFAMDVKFELAGISICTTQYGGYISLTDIRRELGGPESEDYKKLLVRLGQTLFRRQSNIWVYNQQYEFQVSHRMLGVDLYNLCDAGVYNILRGNHSKRYSLKWTANDVLGVSVWDADFDRLEDLLDRMYFITEGKSKKTRVKIFRVTIDTYKETDEWKEICRLYPEFISEFELLINEYWGCPYMNIPADILGYYCNLDSFYTLMIHEQEKDNYSEVARETFLDNLRLGARLHSCGMYKDESYRQDYEAECAKMMAWGISYCAMARCKFKMNKHGKSMAKLKKYHPVCQKLIKSSSFFNGNSIEITKFLLSDNLDRMDVYDHGLDEGKLLMTYGQEFAEKFVDIVAESMIAIKFKGKIDEGIGRKKKILGIVSERLATEVLSLDKLNLGKSHLSLEKFTYYETAYRELDRVTKTYFGSVETMPDPRGLVIKAFNAEFSLLDYANYVSDNYFKCKSPIENDEIAFEFGTAYKMETAFLAALSESSQQLDNAEKFFSNLGLNTPDDGLQHFISEWKNYCEGVNRQYTYPPKVFDLALTYWKNVSNDKPKEIWTNFEGFTAQSQFWPSVKSQFTDYGLAYSPTDMTDRFLFMRKFVLNYLLYKKYAKVLSTYLEGMFKKTDVSVIEDPATGIPIREALPGEAGAVTKMFARYEVNTKSSKRWSSGYHTIVSHSDIKSVINTPPGYLLTYFDIGSAEVKSAGFASGDPDLIDKFVKNVDIYVYTGKLYLPDGPWDTDPAFRGLWRKRFKTIFLGILYGLGKRSLAERLNCSEDEATKIIEATFKAFPKLKDYIKSQQSYPFNNDGYVNTFFGDKLRVDEWRFYQNAKSERERSNLRSRIERLGVNLPIQGGTSSAMASGFFNNLRVAKESGWNLKPIIVVHDSNTNYIPISKLFEIRKFYDENFTEFCYGSTGIKLLFDLLCGVDYESACEMTQIDDNNIEFSGNADSLLKIVDKVMECGDINVSCNLAREDLIPAYIDHPIDRFIREKGTSMVMDRSWYTIRLTKLS